MGHVITSNGLQVDPKKVEAIVDMETPKDREAVQRLLGMTNYVQRFAPRLADATKPLRDLLKKENAFVWGKTHDQALDEVRMILKKPQF